MLCDNGETCTDISSLEITGVPARLTPLSPRIAGADILCLVACAVGEVYMRGYAIQRVPYPSFVVVEGSNGCSDELVMDQ